MESGWIIRAMPCAVTTREHSRHDDAGALGEFEDDQNRRQRRVHDRRQHRAHADDRHRAGMGMSAPK
jgi:hypothetical protein